jgi:hypothetical protein
MKPKWYELKTDGKRILQQKRCKEKDQKLKPEKVVREGSERRNCAATSPQSHR